MAVVEDGGYTDPQTNPDQPVVDIPGLDLVPPPEPLPPPQSPDPSGSDMDVDPEDEEDDDDDGRCLVKLIACCCNR